MKKKLFYIFTGTGIILLIPAIILYKLLFGISVYPIEKTSTLYIPSGSSYNQVLDSVLSNLEVRNPELLNRVANKKSYPESIKPGRYIIKEPLSLNELINILRSGRQVPVKITFNNIRTLNQLAGKFGRQLETDSVQIMSYFADESNFRADGFTKETIISLFIPDT